MCCSVVGSAAIKGADARADALPTRVLARTHSGAAPHKLLQMTLEAGKLDERVLSTFASADPGLMAMLIERLGIRTTLPPILPSHCR